MGFQFQLLLVVVLGELVAGQLAAPNAVEDQKLALFLAFGRLVTVMPVNQAQALPVMIIAVVPKVETVLELSTLVKRQLQMVIVLTKLPHIGLLVNVEAVVELVMKDNKLFL